jgi:hypothetical protein
MQKQAWGEAEHRLLFEDETPSPADSQAQRTDIADPAPGATFVLPTEQDAPVLFVDQQGLVSPAGPTVGDGLPATAEWVPRGDGAPDLANAPALFGPTALAAGPEAGDVQTSGPPSAAADGRHVVFIGVDGAQYSQILAAASGLLAGMDYLETFTGGVRGTATQQPTYSGPGWSTLLTGVWADEHGVTANDRRPIDSDVLSLFERIDQAGVGAIASIVNWADINKGHFSRETGRLGDPAVVDVQASGLSDSRVVSRVTDLIGDDAAPAFTFMHLDGPDHAGHAYGFGDEYTEALQLVAQQINAVRAAVAEREATHPGEEWMIVVSTDHGRETSGFNHGGQSASERQSFIASNRELTSDGVAPATSVAATILDFLGLGADGVAGPSLLADDDAIDTRAPSLLAVRSVDDSGQVGVTPTLTMVLSEQVRAGEGSIVLHRASDGAVVETIDAGSDQVTIRGGVVTIAPRDDLQPSTDYYVTVEAGAFVDMETRAPTRLLWEDFESLAGSLQPYQSDTEQQDGDLTDWTATGPAGWTTVDRSTPGGVPEFAGWTFHDRQSWIDTAGDQGRGYFSNGQGVVAVADGDEYYDSGLQGGKFRTLFGSPSIDLTGVEAGTATLRFDSSWLPESRQTVRITVSYDGDAPVEVLRWTSRSGRGDYHADAPSESVLLNLDNPAGARTAVLSFEVVKAANDWWWAIDNIAVDGVRPGDEGANAFGGVQGPDAWTFRTDLPDSSATITAPQTDDGFTAPVVWQDLLCLA